MNEDAVPVSTFTMKADVASSEGAFNVVLSMLYNDLCPYKTPAQEADPNSLLNFYRKAIKLRKSLPVVKNGIYKDHFFMSSRRYIYSRDDGKQKLLVMIMLVLMNLSKKLKAVGLILISSLLCLQLWVNLVL